MPTTHEGKSGTSQFSAVVASANGQYACPDRGPGGHAHGFGHSWFVRAVDHNFVDAMGTLDQFAFDPASEGRAECVVGRGDQSFVLGADFATTADHTGGKRGYYVGQ